MSEYMESRFNEIYDRTKKRILIYITGKCKRTEDISDIFQDTYMELFLILKKKNGIEIRNEEAFLIRIAKRKIYRHYTLMERLLTRFCREMADETDESIDLTDLSLSPEDKAVQQSMIDQAYRYLQTKDELTKKIFYMHYYEDVTIAQIAEMLSVKESTVKNRLYRTLKEMRNYFDN